MFDNKFLGKSWNFACYEHFTSKCRSLRAWSFCGSYWTSKCKKAILASKNCVFQPNPGWFRGFVWEYACLNKTITCCSFPSAKTLPNYSQTKGFVLKHHQNDPVQVLIFFKISILENDDFHELTLEMTMFLARYHQKVTLAAYKCLKSTFRHRQCVHMV